MSSNWGRKLKISIFGESHGKVVGMNIDGLPPGTNLDKEAINFELNRRKPGKNKFTTPRKEDDSFEILSGELDGITTGAPLCVIFKNSNTISKDYESLKDKIRPSHSDYPAMIKYDFFNDLRGGGHFSGRLTAPIVFLGAISKSILAKEGIEVFSHIRSIKDIEDKTFLDYSLNFNEHLEELKNLKNEFLPLIDKSKVELIENEMNIALENHDSIGGIVECMVVNLPVGFGSPFFDSLESTISHLAFSIPSIKGIEFGAGFEITKKYGSEANDSYFYENDEIKTKTNNNGGILGGISNGMPIIFKVAVKPTASIFKEQDTVSLSLKANTKLKLEGRHDPCIVPRVLPVIESVAAISILDHILSSD